MIGMRTLVPFLLIAAFSDADASEVLSWTEDTRAPTATIEAVRWLEGSWQGPLEGGMQQWTAMPALAGDMPGVGRGWGSDGTVWFYEISLFTQVGETLEFRVKHFSQQLAGWEPKDEYVRHRLVAITDDALYFDGITFVKDGPDAHTVYLRISDGERKGEIITVHQKRVKRLHWTPTDLPIMLGGCPVSSLISPR